ncbi:hypothetical protein FSP39_017893 [Pinctada imbricata]|uniref:RING-type domain-containing protein n=1 Tax=Pinctada imbricata TaxID=66713 RepID=A0AA88XW56_PINIB|nr:hypothetical protein FSP39_017893 [Pinctada imbricata]
MENYTCCFVLVFLLLASIFTVFAISLKTSSVIDDDHNNTVFVVLSMTLLSVCMVCTIVCGVACRQSLQETDGRKGRVSRGALYVVSTIGMTGKLTLLKQKGTDCPICWEELTSDSQAKLSCNHVFHKKCIDLHFKVNSPLSCPYCRATPLVFPGPERIKSDIRLVAFWISSSFRCHGRQPPDNAQPEWV